MSIFKPVRESEITRAIANNFFSYFDECIESDVIIVGGGPSGLVAARNLARDGYRVVIIEKNNSLGGGFWMGGYFMNQLTLRAPSHKFLDEIGVPYVAHDEEIYVASAPHACAKLIGAACDAGAKILNLTMVEDIIIRDDARVRGVVINWSAVQHLPREVAMLDPLPLETKVVIDATGHEACVVRKLEKRGLVTLKGEWPMWIERSEEQVVENTSEVYPGLIVTGMAAASVYGLSRMGPTFGAMMLSGEKGAELAAGVCQKVKG